MSRLPSTNGLSPLEQTLLISAGSGGATFKDSAIIPLSQVTGLKIDYCLELLRQTVVRVKNDIGETSGVSHGELAHRLFVWLTKEFEYSKGIDAPFTLPDVINEKRGNCFGLATTYLTLAEGLGMAIGSAFAVTTSLEPHMLVVQGDRLLEVTQKNGFDAARQNYVMLYPQTTADFIAALYYQLASVAVLSSGGEVNKDLLERALLFSPKHPAIRVKAVRHLKGYAEALKEISEVTQTCPEITPYALTEIAMILSTGRQYEKAIEAYSLLLGAYPEASTLLIWRSQALRQLGKLKEAREDLAAYTVKNPGCDPIHFYGLVSLEIKLGMAQQAIEDARIVTKTAQGPFLSDKNAAAYRLMRSNAFIIIGLGLLEMGAKPDGFYNEEKVFAAEAAFGKALELVPTNPAALALRGLTDKLCPFSLLGGHEDFSPERELLRLGGAAVNPYKVPYVTQEGTLWDITAHPVTPEFLETAKNVLEAKRLMATS